MGFLPNEVVERDRLKAYLVYFLFLAGFLGVTAYFIAAAVEQRNSNPPTAFTVKQKSYKLPYIHVCQIADGGDPGTWMPLGSDAKIQVTLPNFTDVNVSTVNMSFCDYSVNQFVESGNEVSSFLKRATCGVKHTQFTKKTGSSSDSASSGVVCLPDKTPPTTTSIDPFTGELITTYQDRFCKDAVTGLYYQYDGMNYPSTFDETFPEKLIFGTAYPQDGFCEDIYAFDANFIDASIRDPDCVLEYVLPANKTCPTGGSDTSVTSANGTTITYNPSNSLQNPYCGIPSGIEDGFCPPFDPFFGVINDPDCESDGVCNITKAFDVDCEFQCLTFNTAQINSLQDPRNEKLEIGGVFLPAARAPNFCHSGNKYTNCTRNSPLALKVYISHSLDPEVFVHDDSFNLGYDDIASTVFLARSEFIELGSSTAEVAYEKTSIQTYTPTVTSTNCAKTGLCPRNPDCRTFCEDSTRKSPKHDSRRCYTIDAADPSTISDAFSCPGDKNCRQYCDIPNNSSCYNFSRTALDNSFTQCDISGGTSSKVSLSGFGSFALDEEETQDFEIFYAQIRVSSLDVQIIEEQDPVNNTLFGAISGMYNMVAVGFFMVFVAKKGAAQHYFRFGSEPEDQDEDLKKKGNAGSTTTGEAQSTSNKDNELTLNNDGQV